MGPLKSYCAFQLRRAQKLSFQPFALMCIDLLERIENGLEQDKRSEA
jgi:hypothetical protein